MRKIHAFAYLGILLLGLACQSVPTEQEPQATAVALSTLDSTEEERAAATPPEIVYDSTITEEYLLGQFDPAKDERFVQISTKHASRGGMWLRKEAYDAFLMMAEAAARDEVKLTIRSATRNFDRQKAIWEAKWTGGRKVDGQNLSKTIPDPTARAQKILQWSSMPGSSRHHWGTDIDINAFENDYFAKGKGLKEYKWLVAYAQDFGYCQPYSPKGAERPAGYNEEKWHWSFLPIAQPLTEQAKLRMTNQKIKGFQGAEAAEAVGVVENYILGINKDCQ